MDRVLIIVGDATETVDTLYPVLRVQEDGFTPVVAGPEKRRYQMVLHEQPPGWDITEEWKGYSIDADIAFRDVDPSKYVGIFFSGGRAPEYIRDDPDLIRIPRYFFEHDTPVASVCHGVEIPCRAGVVKGDAGGHASRPFELAALLIHPWPNGARASLADQPVVAEGLRQRKIGEEDDQWDEAHDGHVVALAHHLVDVLPALPGAGRAPGGEPQHQSGEPEQQEGPMALHVAGLGSALPVGKPRRGSTSAGRGLGEGPSGG